MEAAAATVTRGTASEERIFKFYCVNHKVKKREKEMYLVYIDI